MPAPEGAGAATPPAPVRAAVPTAATAAAFEFFLELGDYAFRHHPPDVWINASTLVRTGVVGPARPVEPRTLRRRVAQAGGLTWAYLREEARRGGHDPHPPAGPERVLATLPFGRRDYVGFLAPVLTRLAEGGRALREVAEQGRKPTVLLMQHGAFSADEAFHDF